MKIETKYSVGDVIAFKTYSGSLIGQIIELIVCKDHHFFYVVDQEEYSPSLGKNVRAHVSESDIICKYVPENESNSLDCHQLLEFSAYFCGQLEAVNPDHPMIKKYKKYIEKRYNRDIV